MSHPSEAPAAAWYPDPQTSGQVRWWDGMNWTEHVSKAAIEAAAETVAEATVTVVAPVATPTIAEQLAAPIVPQHGASSHSATVTFIGRHAAGATPVPRQQSTAPRIRPRVRIELPAETHVEARVEALAYA